MADDSVWSFGYGSNMDVKAVETKKQVKILDHSAAILKGWRLAFNLPGLDFVEPAYANVIRGEPNDEVHGVAFCMSKESMANMDRVETGYNKAEITLEAYNGRKLIGFVYINKPTAVTSEEHKPSRRYIDVLIKGATQAGLQESYIKKLQEMETYTPTSDTLKLRASLPKPEDLPPISVEDLAKHNGKDNHHPSRVAVLGYVIQSTKIFFQAHRGRDRTTRFLMQFHGLSLDQNEDNGLPPYPIIANLITDEKEYISRWLDHYLSKSDCEIVGYLSEFKDQQNSGISTYKLPK